MVCQQRSTWPLIFLCACSAVLTSLAAARGDEAADLAAAASQFEAFFASGRYRDCERAAKKMQSIADRAFPNNKLLSALCMQGLAVAYHHQGRDAEAEPILRRALDIHEKAHGPEHSDVAICLDHLAQVMSAQARYQEAESLCKRALTIHEKAVPPNMAALSDSLRTYGMVFFEQRRYAEAEPFLRRALAMREKVDNNLAQSLNDLGMLYHWQGRYAEAEPLYQRALAIDEKNRSPGTVGTLDNLTGLYKDFGRYGEAEALYRRALAMSEKQHGPDGLDVAIALNNLATFYGGQDRREEAEPLFKRALAIREKALPPDHPYIARSLYHLGAQYGSQGRHAEAGPLLKRALAIRERAFGLKNLDVADSLLSLAILYGNQGRWGDAIPLAERALAIQEQCLGPNHDDLAFTLGGLANWHCCQHRYSEAEPLAKRALSINEQAFGRNHAATASCMRSLAELYQSQKRYDEAEALLREALAILERSQGPEHTDVAATCFALAQLYWQQQRAQDAEPLVERAVAIRDRRRADAFDRYNAYGLRAVITWQLGRKTEAIEDLEQALHLAELARGQSSGAEQDRAAYFGHFTEAFEQMVAWQTELGDAAKALAAIERGRARSLLDEMNLGGADLQSGRSAAEREQLRQRETELKIRAAELERKLAIAKNDDERSRLDLELAQARQDLYDHYRDQRGGSPVYRNLLSVGGRAPYSDALALFERCLSIEERAHGGNHPDVANDLEKMAAIHFDQGRLADAEPLLDRAIAILERSHAAPDDRYRVYHLRAHVAWRLGNRREAVRDLDEALDLAEQVRGQAAGAEQERARFFGTYARAFESMCAWQTELGDAEAALIAIERGRARSLLDEMNMGGAELFLGRSAAEREQLAHREAELKSRLAELERRSADSHDESQRRQRQDELAQARQQLYDHYRDQRSSSPVYRNLLSVGADPPRLRQLQRSLLAGGGVMLVYLFGEKDGYLIAVDEKEASSVPLVIDAASSKTLAIPAGPLTADALRGILTNERHDGIVEQIADSEGARQATAKLAALFKALVPDGQRRAIMSGEVKRLIVVPDGPLALLPFETLVVQAGDKTQYLLDAGPPLSYAPSATVLYNLAGRARNQSAEPAVQPVLTVANPAYGAPAKAPLSGGLAELAARGRYRSVGGTLSALPYTESESAWVAEGFKKQGITVAALRDGLATEVNVRGNVAGRRVLHLACHGLADQAHGNFFGCLALTPGANAATNPADDGFLTLPEIYELNLKQCDLAILSACQTNYGPQQRGEGIWGLSRGFLVAGARRVVASNWLVDDEAAASLVSAFCSDLAKAEGKGETPDYAAALHKAKRWIRGQPKWSSPYYWGTFVLVGPN